MNLSRLVLAFIASVLTYAPAFAEEVVGNAALFTQYPDVRLSPNGSFAYVTPNYYTMLAARTECLAHSGASCPVTRISSNNPFTRNSLYFSKDDSFLYVSDLSPKPNGWASGDMSINEFAVSSGEKGIQLTKSRTFKVQLSRDIQRSIDIITDFSRWSSQDVARYLARHRATIVAAVDSISTRPENVSNVFGRLADDRYVVLRRADTDYGVRCATNGADERLLWDNGSVFVSQSSALPLRFDGDTPVALVAGSVIRMPGCRLQNATASLPRAILINGDDPSTYYGYSTAIASQWRNVVPDLVTVLRRALDGVAQEHVTAISVNNGRRIAVVAHGPFLDTQGGKARLAFQHDFYFGATRRALVPAGEPIAHHAVNASPGGRVFIERYHRPGNRKTVLYLYGGPGEYGNLERVAWPDMLAILNQGANLDIVHYGGSSYTFALKNRLYRDGVASIEADSADIARYVFDSYPADQFLSLRVHSFGGQFVRFLDEKLLRRFDKVVLDAPLGGVYFERPDEATLMATITRMNWGRDVAAAANAYYDALRSCPLVRRTVIIVGREDRVVDPARDYRHCKGSALLEMIVHDGDHLDNPASGTDTAKQDVYRTIARALTVR